MYKSRWLRKPQLIYFKLQYRAVPVNSKSVTFDLSYSNCSYTRNSESFNK
jgi:hypothetical protein